MPVKTESTPQDKQYTKDHNLEIVMKLRKELGSEAVQDLIREACARVAELPPLDIRDPWPSYRDLSVEIMPVKTESAQQDK